MPKISDYTDKITNAELAMDYEHHEIHEGNHFYTADFATLALSATAKFVITPPTTVNKWNHLVFSVRSTKGMTLEVYRNPTGVSLGTPVTPRNSNENFAENAETVILRDPTIVGNGTRIAGYGAGSNVRAGFIERRNENVLGSANTYLFIITSADATNLVSWLAEFYEHVNKNV